MDVNDVTGVTDVTDVTGVTDETNETDVAGVTDCVLMLSPHLNPPYSSFMGGPWSQGFMPSPPPGS